MPPVAEAAALTVVASPATCEGSPACPGEGSRRAACHHSILSAGFFCHVF